MSHITHPVVGHDLGALVHIVDLSRVVESSFAIKTLLQWRILGSTDTVRSIVLGD